MALHPISSGSIERFQNGQVSSRGWQEIEVGKRGDLSIVNQRDVYGQRFSYCFRDVYWSSATSTICYARS